MSDSGQIIMQFLGFRCSTGPWKWEPQDEMEDLRALAMLAATCRHWSNCHRDHVNMLRDFCDNYNNRRDALLEDKLFVPLYILYPERGRRRLTDKEPWGQRRRRKRRRA